jgi:hypothetical protein
MRDLFQARMEDWIMDEMDREWYEAKIEELKGVCEVAMIDLDELEAVAANLSKRINLARQRLGNSQ